ncbi:MAG: RNA methyltransferase, partial [Flavobacteriaceae bacterium]
VYATDPAFVAAYNNKATLVKASELKQMSGLKNPNMVLGVFIIPQPKTVDFKDWVLVLDDVRDPGNLGTIIRLCDWFGIKHLVCSPNTVDCYNPKVLQATMGSVAKVNIVYTGLATFLKSVQVTIYGGFMNGVAVYGSSLPEKGVLIMGNEANGISEEIEALVAHKISIPQFGDKTAESLNVATATAILLNEVRRK